jgi:hypothetical protein
MWIRALHTPRQHQMCILHCLHWKLEWARQIPEIVCRTKNLGILTNMSWMGNDSPVMWISGFHRVVVEDLVLLGYDAVSVDNLIPPHCHHRPMSGIDYSLIRHCLYPRKTESSVSVVLVLFFFNNWTYLIKRDCKRFKIAAIFLRII